MEMFTWQILGTGAGAALAVAVMTQITKDLPGIVKLPTQIWSYILALVILLAAVASDGTWDWAEAALALVNAALVSLAANGGYEAVEHVKSAVIHKEGGTNV